MGVDVAVKLQPIESQEDNELWTRVSSFHRNISFISIIASTDFMSRVANLAGSSYPAQTEGESTP